LLIIRSFTASKFDPTIETAYKYLVSLWLYPQLPISMLPTQFIFCVLFSIEAWQCYFPGCQFHNPPSIFSLCIKPHWWFNKFHVYSFGSLLVRTPVSKVFDRYFPWFCKCKQA
jgi:hypothetical protein